jgi:hypothetical protein
MTFPSFLLRCAGLLLSLAGAGLCQEDAHKYIELTAADLFATHNWNSGQVSVLGFHLGMTWPDAAAQARASNLSLVGQGDPRHQPACEGKGWCRTCEAPGLCNGLALVFGTENEIVQLSIGKIPEMAAKEVQANALQGRLKGATRKLFDRYSKDLRLKLLGPADTQTTTEAKSILFTYRKRGLVVQVSPCPTSPPESSCAGLDLEFVPPAPAN